MTKDLPLKRERTKETTGARVQNTHSWKPRASSSGMQTREEERGEEDCYNEAGRKIPAKKGGRLLRRRGKSLRSLLRTNGTGVKGTGSARDARGVKNQRNTDRILDDLKMSDSPSSLHSSFQ